MATHLGGLHSGDLLTRARHRPTGSASVCFDMIHPYLVLTVLVNGTLMMRSSDRDAWYAAFACQGLRFVPGFRRVACPERG
jgi:hypothetical protein